MGKGSESFGFPLDAVLYSSFGDLPKIFGSYGTFVFSIGFQQFYLPKAFWGVT